MNLPLHSACRLLKSDPSGLLAVDKAAGILSHPNHRDDRSPALMELEYDFEAECYRDGETAWFLLNRLDGPTSGVLLLARDPVVARAVRKAFASHAVGKEYAAVLKGIPPRKSDRWRDFLKVVRRRGTLRTIVVPGRPNAETAMQLRDRGKGPPARALVTLSPVTGRTHQLRVQCASRHLPIIGDATYGDFAFNREFKRRTGIDRLLLHSWKTRVHVQAEGREIRFSVESPLPDVFAVALQ